MWSIRSSLDYLLAAREQMGELYGSDELCIFMYCLVKRERPYVVVELGTGMGVTSAWIAAAMQENDYGMLYTYDNGNDFRKPSIQKYLSNLSGPLYHLARVAELGVYEDFINCMFHGADVENYVHFVNGSIDLDGVDCKKRIKGEKIDVLFSDFMHSPKMISEILAAYLPLMNSTASIFIDSASTFVPSFLMLEQTVYFLNCGKIPAEICKYLSEERYNQLRDLLNRSRFRLNHLIEKKERSQNSTAWLRIEPCDVVPSPAVHLRGY
jgi:tRNA A58 N-methylase Trm61